MKIILTSKTILLLAAAVTLLATAGCVVDDRDHYHHDYHHDHDHDPAVVVRPPTVIVH